MNQNPNPNQQNIIQTIQPAQATKLLKALKEELAEAQNAGTDTAKAKQHFARAEQIKQVLLNYRQQQQRQRSAGGNVPGATPNAADRAQGAGQQMQGGPGVTAGQTPSQGANGVQAPGQYNQAQYAARNLTNNGAVGNAGANIGNAGSPQDRGAQNATRGASTPGSSSAPNSGVTLEKYQDLRKRLLAFDQKIRALEASRRPDMPAEEANKLKNEIQETRLKYAQYSKYFTYMKSQLVGQAQGGYATSGTSGATGSTPMPNPNAPLNTMPGSVPNAPIGGSGTPNQGVSTPTVMSALIAASNANNAQSQASAQGPPSRGLGSTGAVPSVKQEGSFSTTTSRDTMVGPGVNFSLVTKPSVPTLPISNSINVKPSNPVILKPGVNSVRPTLTGGSSTSLGQIVASPAITRMPTYEMASGGPMQDNSGRVLTKRKLTELVNSLGADEGDGKTTIDGDVEELLLDLADEFVSSVTSFACRLAKHRKTDSVDVKDVQLHLERNWNIRIPGYATDEIRSTRKWQPSAAYNQKISGIDIVKSVNENIN